MPQISWHDPNIKVQAIPFRPESPYPVFRQDTETQNIVGKVEFPPQRQAKYGLLLKNFSRQVLALAGDPHYITDELSGQGNVMNSRFARMSEENSEKSGGSCGAICGCAFLPQTKRTQWVK